MSSKPVLYCFAQSGNAYKVALFFALTGQDWTPRFVDFFNGETRTAAYRQSVNAMGEVPVLQRDGQSYSQSGAILTLLSEESGHFTGKTAQERYEVLRWILFDNHKFTNHYACAFCCPLPKPARRGRPNFCADGPKRGSNW